MDGCNEQHTDRRLTQCTEPKPDRWWSRWTASHAFLWRTGRSLRLQLTPRGYASLDLPTSHQGMRDTKGDEFTGRMLGAINSMLVEMMAAIARKDYEQRRERQAQASRNPRPPASTRGARLTPICTNELRSYLAHTWESAQQHDTLTAPPPQCFELETHRHAEHSLCSWPSLTIATKVLASKFPRVVNGETGCIGLPCHGPNKENYHGS